MPNLYHDTAAPAAATPALDGDRQVDVAIVGGGFTGLSTALHLAERGIRCAVVEAHEPGWGASGRNGGQVNPGLKHDPEDVEAVFGSDLGARMTALAGGAPAFAFALIERLGIACEARRNGTLRAALGPRSAAAIRRTAEQLARRGAPVELLDAQATAAATGTTRYRGALLDRRGGDLQPLSFARGLAQAALRAGASIYGDTRAERLERSGSTWRLSSARGSLLAEHVVLATNGYSDDLWPALRRTVVPVFGAMLASEPLPELTAASVMPGRSVLYESGTVTVYYRVDSQRRLLLGGRGPMHEVTTPAPLRHLRAYAQALWPQLGNVAWTHAWGGRLAMTQDQYPHLHEPAPGLTVCLGYNGRGVALATRLGALLAQRIADPLLPFDMPITTPKTIRLHALWPLAVRAVIVQGRVLQALGLS